MQKKIILAGAFTLCLIISFPAYAQQGYSIVYDLYYNLMLYPESGDELIRTNQKLFDSRFYSCMDEVQEKARQAGQRHSDGCNQLISPNDRAECEKNNEGAKLWSWIKDVRSACRGDTRWSETFAGSTMIISKRELERVRPGDYERIINDGIPQLRPMLTCE
jgi:hypothetical protein